MLICPSKASERGLCHPIIWEGDIIGDRVLFSGVSDVYCESWVYKHYIKSYTPPKYTEERFPCILYFSIGILCHIVDFAVQ
jgi:hypothetical protein